MADSATECREGVMSVSSASPVASLTNTSSGKRSESDESISSSQVKETPLKDDDCFLPPADTSKTGKRSNLDESMSSSSIKETPVKDDDCFLPPADISKSTSEQKSTSLKTTSGGSSTHLTRHSSVAAADSRSGPFDSSRNSKTTSTPINLGASTSSAAGRSSFTNSTSVPLPGRSSEKEHAQERVQGSSLRSSSAKASGHTNHTSKGTEHPAGSSSRTWSSTSLATPSLKVVAIVEGRGNARGEIGMAYIDLHNSVLVLSQFADTQAYLHLAVQLNILSPIEVIFPHTAVEARSKVISRIREMFPEILTVTVLRKYFNETKGLQYIQDLCVPEYKTVEVEVSSKYYCLSASAALLKYLEFKQNMTYASQSLKIVYRTTADTTFISTSTAHHLELVANNLRKIEHTLYGILNYTLTPGGDRLLRANILQPSCDISTINTRLDCVSELTEDEDLFNDLKSVIGKFMDTEHVLSLLTQVPKQKNVHNSECKIANAICLKHALDLVSPLHIALSKAKNVLFKTYCEALSDERFQDLQEKLSGVIHTDATWQRGTLNMHMQKCFAIKPNINGLLDIARRAYTESVNDINDVVKQLEKKYNIPLNVAYTSTRGFYIQIQSKALTSTDDIPPIFLKVNRTKNIVTCTTEDLIKLNDRVRESLNEIYLMSDLIIDEVLAEIREYMGCLYNLTEAVSSIDFLLSLAHACTLSDHVRPEFSPHVTAIKGGKHPVVEKIMGHTFIPNDTFLCGHQNFIILSGANMSGKTTYLKQVAILQIMAQIGCYVPANYASLRIADQILSYMGSSCDIEKNLSTFVMQMKEANFVLQNATEKSLIIMDELGRGTNAEEGCGIAYAICEELAKKGAFTICSTHFELLTELASAYTNIENYHFKVHFNLGENSCVGNFTHMLQLGACKEKDYGLKVAELSALPHSVLQDAKEIVKNMSETERNENQNVSIDAETREKIKLAIHLLHVVDMEFPDENDLRDHLKEVKRLYLLSVSSSEPSQTS